ncbi:MAG TPA: M14 family zinc carboxypeptidase [Thermoanaerobaculia bacterium]|nr:M14 family zinc carboxypeptidase [Thermoanaerobaculia bacterium]
MCSPSRASALSLVAALVLCFAEQVGAEEPAAPPLLAPVSVGEALPLPEVDPDVVSPSRFLGYPLGSRFTHVSEALAYLRALAAASPRVAIWSYGESYEGRPLTLVAVSAPENIDRLEEVRDRHQRLIWAAGLTQAEQEALVFTQPTIAWLAYGVHGNESSSTEAALATAYLLAAARGEEAERLREVVVLIDPFGNPDGRERYLSAFEQRRGREPEGHLDGWEHTEPWPGGRFNHYWIDLNRDWAWATQRETRQRLLAYRQWEPHVYLDFHEMGRESTYYFSPPASPSHPALDRRVPPWFETFGQATAALFDRMGWIYFNRERYDLFYPGYGDSYPSLRGGVGMTYEMAGGGRAGQVLALPGGGLLTLADRVTRHLASSLVAVRTVAEKRVALLRDHVAIRRSAAERIPEGVVWDADQPEAEALAALLAFHSIRVHQLPSPANLSVYPPNGGGKGELRAFAEGSYVVMLNQPLGTLAQAVLALDTPLPKVFAERQRERLLEGLAEELYDVSAWSLPRAYDLETFRVVNEPGGLVSYQPREGRLEGDAAVGWLLPPQGLAGYRLAAALARERLLHRVAKVGFEIEGRAYPAGTLFVPRWGNPVGLEDRLLRLSRDCGVSLRGIATSRTTSGISIGSDDMVAVVPQRVGLAVGPGTAATAAGTLWHLLDRDVGLPHRRLELSQLKDGPRELDVLILPDGSGYGEMLGEKGAQALERWVRSGGVVVAVGGSFAWLRQHGLAQVEAWKAKERKPGEGGDDQAPGLPGRLEERPIETPGAILATEMRASHPLAAGLRGPPSVLYQGSEVLLATGSLQGDVLWVRREAPVLAGLVWPEAEQRLAGALLVYHRPLGDGQIIAFAQDPAFRLFWRATMPMFLNAVMFARSW